MAERATLATYAWSVISQGPFTSKDRTSWPEARISLTYPWLTTIESLGRSGVRLRNRSRRLAYRRAGLEWSADRRATGEPVGVRSARVRSG
jgi:hypothetical protein